MFTNCKNKLNAENTERKSLRKKILALRDSLPFKERQRRSLLIADKLWRIKKFTDTKVLFIYANFRSEVETLPLIQQCLDAGMLVTVPLTDPEYSQLSAYPITNPDLDLRPGYCGISEPIGEGKSPVSPREIETVILPGSVFDERGGRLGYGGGYYDRFLARSAPQALRIGLAFEQQVVKQVPLLPHDERLHLIVTEKRIVYIC